jgi:hypothetical protein
MRALVHTEGTSLSVRVGVGVGRLVRVSGPFCRDAVLDWPRSRARLGVTSDGEAVEAHERGEDAKCVHLGGVNWLDGLGILLRERKKEIENTGGTHILCSKSLSGDSCIEALYISSIIKGTSCLSRCFHT